MPVAGAQTSAREHARPGRFTLSLLLFLAGIAGGFFLRVEPALRAGEVEFQGHAAFDERMLRAVAETGHLPEIDPLGLPPEGKPVRALVPPLAYQTSAAFDRLIDAIDTGDLDRSAILLTALCGALITLPVALAAWGLGLAPVAAATAALFAVLSPAHICATLGDRLGDTALGTLLTTGHVAALVLALAAGRGRRLIAASAVAAATLALAMSTQRDALVLVPLESLVVLGAFLVRRLRPPLLIAFAPSLATALATSLIVPHLITGPYLLSRSGALAFLTLGLLLLDAATALHAQRGPRAWIPRAALVAVILLTSLGLGRSPTFDNLLEELEAKLGMERPGDALRVLALPPSAMGKDDVACGSGAADLATTGVIAFVYAAGRRLTRRRSFPAPSTPSPTGLWLWHGGAAAFFLLTLISGRFAPLAAPLLALYPGLLLDSVIRSAGAVPRPALARTASALTVAVLILMAGDAWLEVHRSSATLEPDLEAALSWLRAEAHPGDVVLCDWMRGDVIQSMAGLPTPTDRMIALPEMRRRVAAHAAALYAGEGDTLLSLRRRYEARYLWVSKESQAANTAALGIRYADYFTEDGPTARGSQTMVGRLLSRPSDVPGLAPRFAAGPERIFEFVP